MAYIQRVDTTGYHRKEIFFKKITSETLDRHSALRYCIAMTLKQDMIKKLFALLGDRGWDVIRRAVQEEVEQKKLELRELQQFQASLSGREIKNESTTDSGATLSGIVDILHGVGYALSLNEITELYNERNKSKIATSTIGNYLSKHNGSLFKKVGDKRWAKWSLYPNVKVVTVTEETKKEANEYIPDDDLPF